MDVKIFTDNVEGQARNQIYTLAKQPAFSDCKIRIMPDVHAGAGCVIGFTADLGDKVIPNIVGVDIGCGMLCVSLGNVDIDYALLDKVIRKYIPSGREVNKEASSFVEEIVSQLYCKDRLNDLPRLYRSLGTLGGGNHFIEIDVDEDNNKYLVIHTGSRNLGKQVADIYQRMAIDDISGKNNLPSEITSLIERLKAEGREKEINTEIAKLKNTKRELSVPQELCYLTGLHRDMYLHDMRLCQGFAEANRDSIAKTIMKQMGLEKISVFTSIHNYIDHDNNIVRKGAISAYEGQRVIIPMNMRDGCIIGIGKGNEDWNCSAPHGAGRLMSRSVAKEQIAMEDYEKSMEGIYTTSVCRSTLDESPFAYKPMDEILSYIGDTIEVEKIVKPVYNFKASE